MRISRRELLRASSAGGIALTLSRLGLASAASAEQPSFLDRETLGRVAGPSVGRIDGVAKVTGAKLYVSDFRAADMPGWPGQTSHALLVRTPDASHVYEGIDLDALDASARPRSVVTAQDIAGSGVRVPAFYEGDLFCPSGKTPLYLGQPVALLLFDDFDSYDRARVAFRDRSLLRFGAELVFAICEAKGVEVVILNQGEDTTFEEDLAKDVLEIITVFSARLYGSRSRKNQKLLDGVKAAVEASQC